MQLACLLPPGICLTISLSERPSKDFPHGPVVKTLHCSGRVFHLGAGSSTCQEVCPEKKKPFKTNLFQQHLPPTKIPHSSSVATIRHTVDSVCLCRLPLHGKMSVLLYPYTCTQCLTSGRCSIKICGRNGCGGSKAKKDSKCSPEMGLGEEEGCPNILCCTFCILSHVKIITT